MKKIQRPIALLLCIATLISALSGCGKKKNAEEAAANASEESITRGEWLDLLASNFGAVNSTTEEPYFADITKENDMFSKIQALVELGVIDKREKLKLDSYVTYKEIALNTLTLLGTDVVADYLNLSNSPKEKDLLKFAEDEKIVSKANSGYATRGEAQTAVDRAVNLYVNKPITEKQDVKLKDNVKDMRNKNISYENGNVSIKDGTKINVGDIIILPAMADYPMGLARKVIEIDGETLNTTEPELNEVYKKIDISSTVVPKLSDITPAADGITIEEYSDIEGLDNNENAEDKLIMLSSNADIMPLAKKYEGLSFSIPINFTKEKLSIDTKWNALTLEMGKQNTKLDTDSVPFAYDKDGNQYTEKYSGGFEIKGKISIENLRFDVDVDWSTSDLVKSVSVSPKFTVKVDLSFKGKAEGEELTVFKTAIPIGATGAWVDCLFVIKVGINGDITVKTKMTTESCTTYTKGKGVTAAVTEPTFDNSLQISGNLTVGVGPKAVLTILGIDIADVALLMGLGAKGTLKSTQGSAELPCMDIKAYGPIVSLTLGKDKSTLLNKLGVAVEIKIVDLENALLKPIWSTTYHWESNNGWMKSSECTGNRKTDESSVNNSVSSSSSNNSGTASNNSANQNISSNTDTGNANNKSPLKVEWVKAPKYTFDNIKSTLDGKAWIGSTLYDDNRVKNAKLIDEKGNLLYEADMMQQSQTYNDIIIACKNSQYGMITTSGKVIIPMQPYRIQFQTDWESKKVIIAKRDADDEYLGHILDKNGNSTGKTVRFYTADINGGGADMDKYLYINSANSFYQIDCVTYDEFENKSYTAFFGLHFNAKNDVVVNLPILFTAYIADSIGSEVVMGEFEVKGYKGCGVFVNNELKSKILYASLEILVEKSDWNKSLFYAGEENGSEEINRYFITNAYGEKVLNDAFENIVAVDSQNSIPVKQNGKWGFIGIPIL